MSNTSPTLQREQQTVMAGQKPRPRMTAYAFYLQMVRLQHASRNPRQQVGG